MGRYRSGQWQKEGERGSEEEDFNVGSGLLLSPTLACVLEREEKSGMERRQAHTLDRIKEA